MILDEVQTGIGRTGEWFAYQHYDIGPDIITMAKALGGGVAIGAMMATSEVAASLVPGTHASTFGGNPLACAAAVAVIETIEADRLLDNANKMGEYTNQKLGQLKEAHPVIDHIRGKGLMIGIQLTDSGKEIVDKCLEKGLRINCTHDTVLRFMPSMTVTKEQIDRAIEILDDVLSEVS
jgi:acetylornithine/N-succinyldiaminopimelate aminotransferase